jgi:RNA polymerase-interacting CarD/CdnL/TRCF family regulator
MEKHAPQSPSTEQNINIPFQMGETLIYFPHGKCLVDGVITRTVSDNVSLPFYKLEIVKSALSRSTKKEPAIWVPVDKALSQGLRRSASPTEIAEAWSILENRESYFSSKETWQEIASRLDHLARKEGLRGLAQAASLLYAYKKKFVIPPTEVLKAEELIMRHLSKEIADAQGEFPKTIEEKAIRAMRHKLHPEQ